MRLTRTLEAKRIAWFGSEKRSISQPWAGELGFHDYLKRSIAYPVRRVYNCANETSHNKSTAKIGPTPRLGQFSVGWKSLACSQPFIARDKSLSARGTLDTLRVDAAHLCRRNQSPTFRAIPFSTLNFIRSNDVIWGINFKRFIRRKNEEDLWSAWRRTFGANKISEAGELHGITGIGSGRLFIVEPHALGGFNRLPPSVAASGLTPGTSPLLDLGS